MRVRADVREHWQTARKVSYLDVQIQQGRANDKRIHPLTILQRSVGESRKFTTRATARG